MKEIKSRLEADILLLILGLLLVQPVLDVLLDSS